MANQGPGELLRLLLDADSFVGLPTNGSPAVEPSRNPREANHSVDGVMTGLGTITGQPVVVFAQDPAYRGGSIGAEHGAAIVAAQKYALANRLPIIGIWDGGGARIQEGINSLTAVGNVFYQNVIASGIIPQISLVLGTCAGAACYSPALTDYLIIADDVSNMFLTGPAVTADFIGEHAPLAELGGAKVHSHNGVADYVAPDVASAIAFARCLLLFLTKPADPRSALDPAMLDTGAPNPPGDGGADPWLPASATQPYDVRFVLDRIFDPNSFLELQKDFAPNLITGFARLTGTPVAIIASQPADLAGTIDGDAAEKGARFINTVASFGIPIITFVDVPGFLPGTAQEKHGIIRKGARLVAAYVKAQVPKITVIMRKGYGGAYIALNSKTLGATKVFAWPDAEVSVMGAAGAVDVLHHRALAGLPTEDAAHKRTELIKEFSANSPGLAAAIETGQVTAIIDPADTRNALIEALGLTRAS